MKVSSVGSGVGAVLALGLLAGCGLTRGEGPTAPSAEPHAEGATPPSATGDDGGGVTMEAVAAGVSPIRPVSGAITLSHNQRVSWADKPHNGIDYSAKLATSIRAVGKGTVFSYTKPNAGRFGSIRPDGNGPAIWVKHTLQDGSPVYVLYGHTAWWWIDRSGIRNGRFTFNCQYGVIAAQRSVAAGEVIGSTAPFYNGGKLATHLHLSVFKPNRSSSGQYNIPPSSGWGYSDVWTSLGQYIDPELFLRTYKLQP